MRNFFQIYIVILLIGILSACNLAETKELSQLTEKDISNNVVEPEELQETNEKLDELATFVSATIVRVIDGDTILIKFEDGAEERVRLLLVDTPESVHPNKPVQPFGLEASNFAKEMMPEGSTVKLEFDVSERDKYGRLLAYVWAGDKMFNELLLEKGLARVAYVFAPNTRHVDKFYEIQQKAQKQAIGIWSIENYATDNGFNEEIKNTKQEENVVNGTLNEKCDEPKIKGNHSSSGELIYHVPGGQFYEKTNPEEMFCTEEEAVAAGYRKSKR